MYDAFLEECKKFISASVETAVDDRRHDDVENGESVVHLAMALSIPGLHAQVKDRCPEGIPTTSIQWLRLLPRRKNSAGACKTILWVFKDQVHDTSKAVSTPTY